MVTSKSVKKLLFVDDDAYSVHAEMIAHFASSIYYYVDIAQNLVEAKLKVSENDFDCIILDLLFPSGEPNHGEEFVFNGLVFLKFLREDSKFKKIPVICLTSALDVVDKVEQLNAKYIFRGKLRSLDQLEDIINESIS